MHRRMFLVSAAGMTMSGSVGCGTLMHSERCGQPHSREIDWKIVALDGLGLLLFFVPGVVAFAVDFCTGAIYLPPEPCHPYSPGPMPANPYPAVPPHDYPVLPPPQAAVQRQTTLDQQRLELARVSVPRTELSLQRIEAVVARHTGRPISLSNSQIRVSQLPGIDHYLVQCRRHRTDSRFGFGIRAMLARWQGD